MPKDPICGMEVDEKKAFKLTYEGRDYFFCCKHCAEKFIQQVGQGFSLAKLQNAPAPSITDIAVCHSITPPSGKISGLFTNKLFIVSALTCMLLGISLFVPILESFRYSFLMYLKTIWWAVLIGLILGGMIDYYVPKEYISKLLSKKSSSAIFNSVLLGFLVSACSHGILAISMQLHKKGASNPAVISFLMASPWANFTITILLLSLFGLKGVLIILLAIVVAITTGLIFMLLEKRGMIETNTNTLEIDKDFSIVIDIKRRFNGYVFNSSRLNADLKGIWQGTVALSNMVLWWIIIGMLIASLAGAYIPTHFFHRFIGPSITGMIATLLLAIIIEVCSEGSSPLAFEIYRQTNALGNSFIFLMAGVVTDYTEIGLIWTNIGKRTALWLPLVAVPQILVLAYLANVLLK